MPTTTTAPTATKTTASPATAKAAKPRKPLPAPNSDFYYLYETLPAEELAIVKRVREFMETKVAPVITDYWVKDQFPFDLLPAVKELGIGGLAMKGYGCAGGSLALVRLCANGGRTDRPIFLHFSWGAYRPGDGLYLYRWVGRAEAEVASANGAVRQDRLFRSDRTARRFRRIWRTSNNRKTRRRYLDP